MFTKVFTKPANIVVPFILFILLSPGLFFTIPENADKYSVVFTHASVFAAVYIILRTIFATYY